MKASSLVCLTRFLSSTLLALFESFIWWSFELCPSVAWLTDPYAFCLSFFGSNPLSIVLSFKMHFLFSDSNLFFRILLIAVGFRDSVYGSNWLKVWDLLRDLSPILTWSNLVADRLVLRSDSSSAMGSRLLCERCCWVMAWMRLVREWMTFWLWVEMGSRLIAWLLIITRGTLASRRSRFLTDRCRK